VTGERLVEVQAVGWGNRHEVLQTNEYENPFWNTTGFFKTSGGHSCRVSVFWHVAAGGTERAQFYGDRLSYIMARPEKSPNTVVQISKDGVIPAVLAEDPSRSRPILASTTGVRSVPSFGLGGMSAWASIAAQS
jgi:hypothetical protein